MSTATDFDYGVEFKTYDDERQGDGLIRMQWRNGEQRSKTGGYFFVPAERLNGFQPAAPWGAFTDTFNNGTEVEGFKAETLRIAIVGVRQQPFIKDSDGRKTWLPKGKYAKDEPGAGLQVDVLCVAEGLEDLGVVCWASSTIKTSFAIVSRGDKTGAGVGILHRIKAEIVKPAEQIAKRELRPWCFWAEITTERDAQGKVVYTPTKGKAVTRPVLKLPATIDKAYLISIATGKDMAAWGESTRAEYDAWFKEERTNDVAPATAQPSGKNVPQEVTDADLLF